MRPSGPVAGEASRSYYLARAYWGHGLASEAAAFFVRRGFDVLGLSRIVTTTDGGNLASRRILDKLGFVVIGVEPGPRELTTYALAAHTP